MTQDDFADVIKYIAMGGTVQIIKLDVADVIGNASGDPLVGIHQQRGNAAYGGSLADLYDVGRSMPLCRCLFEVGDDPLQAFEVSRFDDLPGTDAQRIEIRHVGIASDDRFKQQRIA